MRTARQVTVLLSVALAGCSLACATPVRVSFDEHEDFSSLHTWDWHGRVAQLVDGEHGGGPDLDGLLGRLIGRSLADRGYERSRHDPDFFVTYHLELRRHIRFVQVPLAPYLLDSLHSSPSYWVEGSETARVPYWKLELQVGVFEPGGSLVWRGVVQREFEQGEPPALGAAVASVLERFPRASREAPERVARAGD